MVKSEDVGADLCVRLYSIAFTSGRLLVIPLPKIAHYGIIIVGIKKDVFL